MFPSQEFIRAAMSDREYALGRSTLSRFAVRNLADEHREPDGRFASVRSRFWPRRAPTRAAVRPSSLATRPGDANRARG